jgi:hypothetical protein
MSFPGETAQKTSDFLNERSTIKDLNTYEKWRAHHFKYNLKITSMSPPSSGDLFEQIMKMIEPFNKKWDIIV